MKLFPIVAALVLGSACGTSSASVSVHTDATTARPSATTSAATSNQTIRAAQSNACNHAGKAPSKYAHVVVIMEENRRWANVGAGFASMPYLHQLASTCAYYPSWTETNIHQNSLTQYIGLTSGVDNPATRNDCDPSPSCRSTDNNIFRQVRASGGTVRSFVEGNTSGCSVSANASRHVPELYYYGGNDHAACAREVKTLTTLDVNRLPTFAMITPNLCNDGHDCPNSRVDSWLSVHLGAILAGASYRSGSTAVFVLYDEDRPVPNLIIAPTARPGPRRVSGAGHAAALRTFEEMLGLPILAPVRNAPSLRASSGG